VSCRLRAPFPKGRTACSLLCNADGLTRLVTLRARAPIHTRTESEFGQIGLKEKRTPFFHFGLTNAPGPTVPMYLCGAQWQGWTALVPRSHGFGLGFAVTSYLDKLWISFTADRKAVPDPALIEQCIDRSVAAGSGPTPGARHGNV